MAIVIGAKLQLSQATQAVDKLDAATKRIQKTVADLDALLNRATASAGKLGAALGGVGLGSGGSGGSGGGGGYRGRGGRGGSSFIGPPAPPGPQAPPVNAYQAYANRRNQSAQFRARYNQQYGGRGGSTNPLMNAFMRSRIDSSGNLMPLVMDLMKLLPAELRAAAAVLLVGVKLAISGMQAAAQYRENDVMGGPGGRAAQRFKSVGIDVGAMGRNTMSGYGPIAAAAAGVNPMGGPFGDINYNQKGIKELDWIRQAKTFEDARRRAEITGSPEAANAWLLDPDVYSRLRNAQDPSLDRQRQSANFDANVGSIGDSLNRLKIDALGDAASATANALGRLADLLDGDLPGALGTKNGGQGAGWKWNDKTGTMDYDPKLGGKDDPNTDATNENTKALHKLSDQMGAGGGGPRAAAEQNMGYKYGLGPHGVGSNHPGSVGIGML